ncbi:uncharacterized protein LOC128958404 [Oppia nitens]|uniref:uncharacterized protein LOC128958404 n=1 Tax=Oppia nitens TaxID=1686743 RepID=UPI0023DA1B97|nr:uncharacterized protein LOC128958404 [Oppia nitens]
MQSLSRLKTLLSITRLSPFGRQCSRRSLTTIPSQRHLRQQTVQQINDVLTANQDIISDTNDEKPITEDTIRRLKEMHPLVKTLNINQWIKDIEDQVIDLNDGSFDTLLDSLIDTNYFTDNSLQDFFNIKVKAIDGHLLSSVQPLRDERCYQLCEKSEYFLKVIMKNKSKFEKKLIKDSSVDEKSVDVLMTMFLAGILMHELHDFDIKTGFLWYSLYGGKNVGTKPDSTLYLNDTIALSAEAKPYISAKQLPHLRAQVVGQMVSTAAHNLSIHKHCSQTQSFGLLVHSNEYYFYSTTISARYLDNLSTKLLTTNHTTIDQSTDDSLCIHQWFSGKGLNFCRESHRKLIAQLIISIANHWKK